jgi:hypothetical protein
MSDLTTTQIFAAGEKNITATKMNNIIGGAVIQPDFYANKPTASSVAPTDQMLILKSGAYAQTPFQTIVDSVGSSMGPQITAVRLRSFNALAGNPTFEVDQANVGNVLNNPVNNTRLCDRWILQKSAPTAVVNTICSSAAFGAGQVVPGTNFVISRGTLGINISTVQSSLAATDYYLVRSFVEGPRMRELSNDVHSISVLAWTNVSGGLKFSVALRDPGSTRSLVKLCTIPGSVWTLVTLPNLPVWASGGAWSTAPGVLGYEFDICLAAGTTLTAPAADVWQTGNFVGAPGMDNYLSKSGGQFSLAFVQHEPGAQCTTPIDCPYQQAYDDALRYYQKTNVYSEKPGAISSAGAVVFYNSVSTGTLLQPVGFKKIMAKIPTMTAYSTATGAANTIRNATGAADITVNSFAVLGDGGFGGVITASAPPVNQNLQFHYTADTGW